MSSPTKEDQLDAYLYVLEQRVTDLEKFKKEIEDSREPYD